MAIQERRARDRAERERRIISVARELAERDGWEAVTTRRLSDAIEYSQPVLYSHFPDGKAGIAAALALDGFVELGTAIRDRRGSARIPRTMISRLAEAYLDFAEAHPELYRIMFAAPTTLVFADDATPGPLRQAFDEVLASVAPAAGDHHRETYAEVVWSSLHGLATLARDGRLPADHRKARVKVLVDCLVGPS
ncbi:TetR/AcrR family transcriptional regulator [Microlunatus sp. Gsoil 973]|jgi:AcrR family transcriptional regulator|uniref:TetR/AcrR family transcriptional regulator n=1 Tax=Microlunatus sp. Gsoil 973 TaxID=2672569 RepID=UPI0012B461A6|nr:TetR/AcrR family transcriptional regulator [Microlunatus sp. Gsoil 973]QGN35018.1 TetR family transcriptional regulator [Microlunatus sp. Gsoil 973]